MGKLKFYALCSRNTRALSRHARKDRSGIPREDLVIVLNTLDKDFKEEAIEWCDKNDVEYVVTESDGTPSTGKNSVLDLFLKSDNDYMVLIDGDDLLCLLNVAEVAVSSVSNVFTRSVVVSRSDTCYRELC